MNEKFNNCSIYNFRKFVRNFKTERSIAAEIKRNPTVVSRVKSAFAGNIKLEETMSNSETLRKLLKKSSDSGGTKDEVGNEKLVISYLSNDFVVTVH